MSEAKLLEFMIVISMCLQGFVILLALILYGYIPDKSAWKWFLLASIVVFARRLTATYEFLSAINTNMLEALETAVISLMWIIYVLKRSRTTVKWKLGEHSDKAG